MKHIVLVCALGLFACAGAQTKSDQFMEVLARFHHHLLAGELDVALQFVAPSAQEAFLSIHDPARTVNRPEDFNVVTIDTASDRVLVVVTADVRKENSLTIRSVRLKQVWEHRDGRWLLMKEEIVPTR